MSKIKTTINQIAQYWMENNEISELELNFDWSDANTHCWNCGENKMSSKNKIRLERCHIIPNALGGEDTPSNYVLLCKICHSNAPNNKNPKYMWDWIKSNKTDLSFYGTYKIQMANKLFIERKGYSFFDHMINNKNDIILEILKDELSNINTHLYYFNIETYYTLLSEIDDKIKNK
jgi:hypothetical protein